MKYYQVRAKFNPLIVGVVIFFLLLKVLLVVLVFEHPEIFLILAVFIALLLYCVVWIIGNSLLFRADTHKIRIGLSRVYSYDDLIKVDLYDSVGVRFMFLSIIEDGMTLYFKNGDKVSLKNSYYKNLWEIRWFMESKFHNKASILDFRYHNDSTQTEITQRTIPISIIMRFFGILIPLSMIFLIVVTISWFTEYSIADPFFPILLVFLLFSLIFGSSMYYLESSSQHLIIKNLLYTFLQKRIDLQHIESAHLKSIGGRRGRTTVLIIHTVYHRDFSYGVDFTHRERLKNSIAQLRQHGIPFTDHT